jgi:hypothetical protein
MLTNMSEYVLSVDEFQLTCPDNTTLRRELLAHLEVYSTWY